MELKVETTRPNIEYNLRGIVEEMLECGQTYLKEVSSFAVSLKIGTEEPMQNIARGEIEISVTVPDSLLEKIKANL